jgi:cyclophilin family peptidyl-prolyl cis-trans isomerase
MPSEKRARKRANRQAARQAQEAAKRKRRSRRQITALLVVLVLGGGLAAFLTSQSSHPKHVKLAAKKSTVAHVKAKTTKTTSTTKSAPSVTAGLPTWCGTASAKKLSFTSPPPTIINPKDSYQAVVRTKAGSFTMDLYTKDSQSAVNNFVFLACHDFFNGSEFQRVIPGFVVQGGGPPNNPQGGPGYSFDGGYPPDHAHPKTDNYALGAVAVANSGTPSSDGSQFFIVAGPQGESLPPNYTLFGQVVSGMKVVEHIDKEGSPGEAGVPKVLYKMESVTIKAVAPPSSLKVPSSSTGASSTK